MTLITDKNRCIDKTTFKDMIKRVKAYNGTPKIVYLNAKTQKEWVTIEVFQDMNKRWDAWIKNNTKEPECVFIGTPLNPPTLQTGNVYEQKYITDYNIRQDTSYYCGLNVLQNIWYTLYGVIPSEAELAKVAGTTTKGTDHNGLNKALDYLAKKYGKKISYEWKNFSSVGWKGVEDVYKDKNRAIGFHLMYRNTTGHYEVGYFINRTTNVIGIINSLGNKDSKGNYLGYFEKRSFKDMQSYINGISQPSCLIVTKK